MRAPAPYTAHAAALLLLAAAPVIAQQNIVQADPIAITSFEVKKLKLKTSPDVIAVHERLD